MRTLLSLFLLISLLYSCGEAKIKKQPVDWVDPQIGSVHCRWFFYTPAALPMGMAKLAPTTNAYGSYGSWLPCGYDDRHQSIEGFAHFHEFQIGGVITMPTTGTLKDVYKRQIYFFVIPFLNYITKNNRRKKTGSEKVKKNHEMNIFL